MIEGFATEGKLYLQTKILKSLRVFFSSEALIELACTLKYSALPLSLLFFLKKSASSSDLINSYLVVEKSACTNTTIVD